MVAKFSARSDYARMAIIKLLRDLLSMASASVSRQRLAGSIVVYQMLEDDGAEIPEMGMNLTRIQHRKGCGRVEERLSATRDRQTARDTLIRVACHYRRIFHVYADMELAERLHL
jgi:hypothetical protein